MSCSDHSKLLLLLIMVSMFNSQGKDNVQAESTAEPFKFSIQPPTEIDCNPLNTELLLMCGVTRIKGNGVFDIQWFHYNTIIGTTEMLNQTSVANENFIKIAVYDGLTMISNITEITGQYWCNVTSNYGGEYKSNILLIDHETNYSMFEPCEDILIEKECRASLGQTEATKDTSASDQLIQGFVPVLAIETVLIFGLSISNIIFVVLWRKRSINNQERAQKAKPIPPERKNLSQSDRYDPILMSITELRKEKPPDPDYVLPDTFHDPSSKSQSTATLTKEVGGHLYAIANPKTRDDNKDYQKPNTYT